MSLGFSLIVALALCIYSCGPTETVINAPQSEWELLVLTDSVPSKYVLINQPANEIADTDLFRSLSSGGIGGRVTKIMTFRDNIYVILPDIKKVEVLNAVTFARKTTFDFSATNKIPSDIIFANATTGYIAFGNTSVVSLVDITNFKVVRDIEVGAGPVSFEVKENQIYCALQRENTVAVLDSRTNAVTTKIPVSQAPTVLKFTRLGTNLAVLCLGGGKIDNSPKSPARVSVVNVQQRSVIGETLLNITADSSNETARGMVVTENDFAYVPASQALLKIDIRRFNRSTVLRGSFRSINYNSIRNELLIADSAKCIIAETEAGEVKEIIPLRVSPSFIFSR